MSNQIERWINERGRKHISYMGNPISDENTFDAELIENSYYSLKSGKAIDLDCLSAEHFQFSHPLLPTVLSKLFNVMISVGHVPPSFCYSYSVPLVKNNYIAFSKSLRVHDFRGILNRFANFLTSSDNHLVLRRKWDVCMQISV